MFEKCKSSIEHRHVDMTSFAGRFACIERGSDATEHEGPADQIRDRRADPSGRPIRKPRYAHQPAHRLHDRVVGGKALPRAGLAETRAGSIIYAGDWRPDGR